MSFKTERGPVSKGGRDDKEEQWGGEGAQFRRSPLGNEDMCLTQQMTEEVSLYCSSLQIILIQGRIFSKLSGYGIHSEKEE